jgi:hypothetical protein
VNLLLRRNGVIGKVRKAHGARKWVGVMACMFVATLNGDVEHLPLSLDKTRDAKPPGLYVSRKVAELKLPAILCNLLYRGTLAELGFPIFGLN